LRIVIDLEWSQSADGVEGQLFREGSDRLQPFSSWLELLRLLEELTLTCDEG
jgi:hypothetical protein